MKHSVFRHLSSWPALHFFHGEPCPPHHSDHQIDLTLWLFGVCQIESAETNNFGCLPNSGWHGNWLWKKIDIIYKNMTAWLLATVNRNQQTLCS